MIRFNFSNISLFLLVFNFFISNSQVKLLETEKKLKEPQNDFNHFDKEGLKQGLWKGYYEDTKFLRYEGTFKKGKEVGIFKYYTNSDKNILMATREFDANDNAYTIFYDEKKNIVSEGSLYKKLRTGIWKYYHKNSKVIMTIENYKDDKLSGIRKVFFSDGKLAEEVNYQDNLKNGVYKQYYKDGILKEEAFFVNGKMHGSCKIYNEKGELIIKGQYKNDKKNSIWEYYEKGEVVRRINTDTINGFIKPSLKKTK